MPIYNMQLKEFIDKCHQNGIAVILDIALNHATGRNPLVRMWMDDPDDDGWGDPSSENPYFNTVAQHDYSVFNDLDSIFIISFFPPCFCISLSILCKCFSSYSL